MIAAGVGKYFHAWTALLPRRLQIQVIKLQLDMEYEKAKMAAYVEKCAPYMVKLKMYEKFEFERGRLGHVNCSFFSIYIINFICGHIHCACRNDSPSCSSTLSKVKFRPYLLVKAWVEINIQACNLNCCDWWSLDVCYPWGSRLSRTRQNQLVQVFWLYITACMFMEYIASWKFQVYCAAKPRLFQKEDVRTSDSVCWYVLKKLHCMCHCCFVSV